MAGDDEIPRDELPRTPPAPLGVQAEARLAGPIENFQIMEVLLDLQGQVSRVEGAQIVLSGQNADLRRDMRDASDSRSELHKRVNSMALEVAAAHGEARSAAEKAQQAVTKLELVTPDVADFVRLRRAGLWVMGGLGTLIVIAIGTMAKETWNFVAGHLHWR
jgi:hypothetical protein